MRKYKLYLDGVMYIDSEGNITDYKLTYSRDSKKAAITYGKNATITDMHDRVVSKAILGADGNPYNVLFDREELLR